jgi:hypothetical protein
MSNDSGGGATALWVALIGLATTIAGGVLANWDRIFPPPSDPQAALVESPPGAGGTTETISQPEAEPAGAAAPDPEASEAAR